MTDPANLDDPILRVTLQKGGRTRRCEIVRSVKGWAYLCLAEHGVSAGALPTLREALAKRQEFEAEIEVARAEGWI